MSGPHVRYSAYARRYGTLARQWQEWQEVAIRDTREQAEEAAAHWSKNHSEVETVVLSEYEGPPIAKTGC